MNCNFIDICDCNAIPTKLCPTKQIVEYCLTESKTLEGKNIKSYILKILQGEN